MNIFNFKDENDDCTLVKEMTKTEGWSILKNHIEEQMKLLSASNAVNARNWEHYQYIKGKIEGMELILVDVDEFIRKGK